MTIYMCPCDKVVYVAEALSVEEAMIRLFNRMAVDPIEQTALAYGRRQIKECREPLASVAEYREVCYV